ncbi:hypothetical protein F4553_006039 [Allocatelliglobosispora scoriae]|uniref:RCK N-terminal domain-containing protein n=1 Tax=Allocatelliglobosispora scoriae TaxID=643052 RepID=A0A841BY65_9ACTN|nr:hypothetical protein [Allocatelliglobosispora scoriae]MBB5872605.1 hypothetical protein [Allocatelliglobosispora scoriae]
MSIAAWAFAGLVVATLVTGYLGLREFVHDESSPTAIDGHFFDLVYYDLQLFVLGADPLQNNSAELPLLLQIARFLAPAVTIYALIGTVLLIFAKRMRAYIRRHRNGHVVVVGGTQIAETILANLLAARKAARGAPWRASRRRMGKAEVKAARRPVAHDVDGTAESLIAAGIAGASVVYAAVDETADGAANVAVALAARSVPRKEPRLLFPRRVRKLRVYAHVGDPKLRVALRARRLGLRDDEYLHLDFFNVEELAAERLLKEDGPKIGDATHVLIAGLGVFGQAVLVELARQRRLHAPAGAPLLEVTLIEKPARPGVGPTEADHLVRSLRERNPAIDATCVLQLLPEVPADVPAGGQPCPDRVYVCYEDENLALKTALSQTYLWHTHPQALVVRLNRMARHSEAFQTQAEKNQKQRWRLLDDLDGRLRLIGVADLGCQP